MAHCLEQCAISAHHNGGRCDDNGISMVHMLTHDMEEWL